MYRACGVQAIIPHVLAGAPGSKSKLELYGWDQAATNAATRAGRIQNHSLPDDLLLVERSKPGLITLPPARSILVCLQLTNNTSIVFAWAAEGQTVSLINSTLAATDLYGNSVPVTNLTEMPVLFQSSTLSAAALLTNVLTALPPGLNLPPIISPIGSQSVSKDRPCSSRSQPQTPTIIP